MAAVLTLVSGCASAADGLAVPAADAVPLGVVPTSRTAVPALSVTCEPHDFGFDPGAERTGFVSADPSAPLVGVAVPSGWAPPDAADARGTFTMAGPNGMSSMVTIAKTPLRPADAFQQYADEAKDRSSISAQAVLPADFCGYSSQKLIGTWSHALGDPINYADRITHVWTNESSDNYLVAVHLEGPAGAPGFDDAEQLLMAELEIRIR